MIELDELMEQVKRLHQRADHAGPGAFKFVTQITTVNGECCCVVVVAKSNDEARLAASKALLQ